MNVAMTKVHLFCQLKFLYAGPFSQVGENVGKELLDMGVMTVVFIIYGD